MTLGYAATLLVLFLPFLISLAGQPGLPKMLCLLTSVLALLTSSDAYAVVLPWFAGMAISAVSVRERIYRRGGAIGRHLLKW